VLNALLCSPTASAANIRKYPPSPLAADVLPHLLWCTANVLSVVMDRWLLLMASLACHARTSTPAAHNVRLSMSIGVLPALRDTSLLLMALYASFPHAPTSTSTASDAKITHVYNVKQGMR
jgi:hypothetical protein